MDKLLCAFTPVCNDDAERWLPQYLTEAERMEMPFALMLDRCNPSSITAKAITHPLCAGHAVRKNTDGEYTEKAKQLCLEIAIKERFHWAVSWDVDETWSKDAPAIMREAAKLDCDYVKGRWVNLWGDKFHLRTDGPFKSHRDKMFNLHSGRWEFRHHIINGPKLLDAQGNQLDGGKAKLCIVPELVCIHHGLMNRELLQQHKERWDRVYALHAGHNPYGIWNWGLNHEEYPPCIEDIPPEWIV